MKKNRIPIIKRASDEFEINIAGQAFKPHEGESVYFIPYLSVDKAVKLGDAVTKLDEEEIGMAESFNIVSDISEILVDIIDHWDWTHPLTGEPIGKKTGGEFKPSANDIKQLSVNEVNYLITEFFGAMSPEENPPPASSEQS